MPWATASCQFQRGLGGVGVEAALAVRADDLAAALPQERVPGEVLVVAGIGLEQDAEALVVGQLLGHLQQLVPGLRDVGLAQAGVLEGLDAVVDRHRLDLHRQAEQAVIDQPGGDGGVVIVGADLGRDIGGEVQERTAIVVAQEVAGADQEDVGPLAGGEGGLQLGAVDVLRGRDVFQLDLGLLAVVPALHRVLEPLHLAGHGAAGGVELPELQRSVGRPGARQIRHRQQAAADEGGSGGQKLAAAERVPGRGGAVAAGHGSPPLSRRDASAWALGARRVRRCRSLPSDTSEFGCRRLV